MEREISYFRDEKIYYNHVSFDNPMKRIFDLHTHDICELIFLKNGNASAIIGDKTYKLYKNSLIIFRSNVPHRIRIDGNTEYDRHDIFFDENTLSNQIFNKIPKEIDVISYRGNRYVSDLFEKLDYYCEAFQGKDLKILVTNIVEELLFNLYLAPKDEVYSGSVTVHPLVSCAIEYINAHYEEQITIDDICKNLCVTKSHLHHLFVENLRISPKKYVNIKRLSKAQKLIRMGEKPSAIYTLCGFNDYGTFFRNYTGYFGYTPSQKNEIIIERKIES